MEYEGPPKFDEETQDTTQETNRTVVEGTMEISINAIEGGHNPRTIVMTGEVGHRTFSIQIDGGSTHSFIDPNTAKRLGCLRQETTPRSVTVANGNQLVTRFVCPDFKWKMSSEGFIAQLRVLPLGSRKL